MLDKSDTNSSEKIIIKSCIDNANKYLRSSVPVLINEDIAVDMISN